MYLGSRLIRIAGLCWGLCTIAGAVSASASAYAQTPAARASPLRGTVKSTDGSTITITTDAGQELRVLMSTTTRLQRLSPGSTDLKSAEAAISSDISVGDRVLVVGAVSESPRSIDASRVILMKSSDIAQQHEMEQEDWKKRGTGGVVSSVDTTTGELIVAVGARKLMIRTVPPTVFKRYADGSVRFEDARPGKFAEIQVGDQVLARGAESSDGSGMQAEELVSGSFKNLSGTIVSLDVSKNTLSLKDIVAKRVVTVLLTTNSTLHKLPAESATAVASAMKAAPSSGSNGSSQGNSTTASSTRQTATDRSDAARPGGARRAGGDFAQIVARLPAVTLSDFHIGDAVMIVAEQSSENASNLTVITLLGGVEAILAAPSGSGVMTLSPWGIGGGGAESATQ